MAYFLDIPKYEMNEKIREWATLEQTCSHSIPKFPNEDSNCIREWAVVACVCRMIYDKEW